MVLLILPCHRVLLEWWTVYGTKHAEVNTSHPSSELIRRQYKVCDEVPHRPALLPLANRWLNYLSHTMLTEPVHKTLSPIADANVPANVEGDVTILRVVTEAELSRAGISYVRV